MLGITEICQAWLQFLEQSLIEGYSEYLHTELASVERRHGTAVT